MAQEVYERLEKCFPYGEDERAIFDFLAGKNAPVKYHEINEFVKERGGPKFLSCDTEFAVGDLRNNGLVELLGEQNKEGIYKISKKGLKIHKAYKKSSSKIEKIL